MTDNHKCNSRYIIKKFIQKVNTIVIYVDVIVSTLLRQFKNSQHCWEKCQFCAQKGYFMRKVLVEESTWCTEWLFCEKSWGGLSSLVHEKGVSCEKLWIMRKMNTLQTKKPPSGGPRSPCICVANTARAGAAGLARASKQSGDGRTRTSVFSGLFEFCI